MNKFLVMSAIAVASLAAVSCKHTVKAPQKPDYQMSYTVGNVTLEMTKMPAGFFKMGMSSDNRKKVDDSYVREVALDGFVISAPVTNALWKAVMGDNRAGKPEAPVDMVSWVDIQKFIAKLNKVTGKVFMLPDEAQWEYASGTGDFGKVLGKRSEWCLDSYVAPDELRSALKESMTGGLSRNPAPVEKGDEKVIRTMYARMPLEMHTRKAGLGFRLVQPTGETFSEDLFNSLTGAVQDREPVRTLDGKSEKFTVNGVEFEMVKVSGGTFMMGFSESDMPFAKFSAPENEKNAHEVTLDDFEIGKTEVTAALWKAVMGSLPYLNDPEDLQKPVGNVSWFDCKQFILRLNSLTGRKFCLPTEAEWEYAARGGKLSKHSGFSGSNDAGIAMWFVDNAKMEKHDVATKKPNELGIYDMSGNVWEWCNDFGGNYGNDAQTNPVGPEEGDMRVMRGGSCASKWDACRISNRSFIPPENIKSTFGLRLAI